MEMPKGPSAYTVIPFRAKYQRKHAMAKQMASSLAMVVTRLLRSTMLTMMAAGAVIQTEGTRKGRGRLGSRRRRIGMAAATTVKAMRVPVTARL